MSERTPLLSPELRNWLSLILLSLVWGTSFILIKKSLIAFSAIQVACLRMSFSALAFVPLLLWQWRRVDWSKLWILLAVGLTGTALPAILFSTAQTQISSSLTGILNSLTPLFTLVFGLLFFRQVFSWSKVAGVLIGLAGASILILLSNNSGVEGNIWYALLIVLATMCYGTSGNIVGTYLRDMNSLLIAATSFGLVGIPGLIYLFSGTNFLHRMQYAEHAWASLGYVAILALIGTVAASVLFFRLIQWTSPLFGSTVAYLMPVVALLWGVVDGESVFIYHIFGMILILLGVYLSRKRPRSMPVAQKAVDSS